MPLAREKSPWGLPEPCVPGGESLRVGNPALDAPKAPHDFHEVQELDAVMFPHPPDLTRMAREHGPLDWEDVGDVDVLLGQKTDAGQRVHEQHRRNAGGGRLVAYMQRYGSREGGIQNKLAGGRVIGMVVVRMVREDHI